MSPHFSFCTSIGWIIDIYFALIGGTSHQFYPHPYKLGDMDFFVEKGKKLETYTTEKETR